MQDSRDPSCVSVSEIGGREKEEEEGVDSMDSRATSMTLIRASQTRGACAVEATSLFCFLGFPKLPHLGRDDDDNNGFLDLVRSDFHLVS